MAASRVLYGVVIKDAVKTKDLKTMKAVAAEAQKHINDLQSSLKSLQAAIDKMGKK